MRRGPIRSLPLCITALAVVMIVVMTSPGAGDGPDLPPGGDGDPDPRALWAAAEVTRASASARVELRTTVAGPSGPVTLVHRGAFTDGGVRARAESDMSEVAAALEAAGQQLDGDWSRPAAIVVDGDTVFSQLGPMADALGRSPDDWARARLSDVAVPASVADNDTLALALDPLGPLDLLRRPVVEMGVVGAEEVRGTPTRHLRARLDLTGADADAGTGGDGNASGPEADGGGPGATGTGTEADDAAETAAGGNGEAATSGRGGETTGRNGVPVNGGSGAAPRGGVPADAPAGSFEDRLVAAGFTSLPVDVWVDGEGAVRRLVVTVEGAGSVTTTFEVFDIGGDVEVATPDPSDVIDP
jgi:hypothetical protein